jgi:hypothetical protein
MGFDLDGLSVLPKKSIRPSKMSAPAEEGGQDDDDILGFPRNGFEDKPDSNPGVHTEQDEEGDETQMQETSGGACQGSNKKRKKTAVVPPDETGNDEKSPPNGKETVYNENSIFSEEMNKWQCP